MSYQSAQISSDFELCPERAQDDSTISSLGIHMGEHSSITQACASGWYRYENNGLDIGRIPIINSYRFERLQASKIRTYKLSQGLNNDRVNPSALSSYEEVYVKKIFRCGGTHHYPLLPSRRIPAHPRSFFKKSFLQPVGKATSRCNRYTRLLASEACAVAVRQIHEGVHVVPRSCDHNIAFWTDFDLTPTPTLFTTTCRLSPPRARIS